MNNEWIDKINKIIINIIDIKYISNIIILNYLN